MHRYCQVLVILCFLVTGGCLAGEEGSFQPGEARMKMVKQQISARGVSDERVLEAMRDVERHLFVPEELREYAYSDRPLPIGEGQTISQPYVVAFMTEKLDLEKSDKVLEVGTGSGYQAAVLGEICDSVWTIEVNGLLAEKAARTLRDNGYDNVHVRHGDGYLGWPEEAPFDAIIVTCAPSDVPKPLEQQLSEGGRMIIPVGAGFGQELVLLVKSGGKLVRRAVLPVRFVPMVNEEGDKY